MNLIRFLFLASLKIIGKIVYPSKLEWIGPAPTQWKNVSVVLILNHTSLFEFVYGVLLPFGYLYEISRRLVIPVADVTLKKPIAGSILRHLAPKTIGLSRKRDQSWQIFLSALDRDDLCIFMPEGEMKRKNGLNKHGEPMRVKKGVYDLLQRFKSKEMIIVYSHGLHHIMAPGDHFPRIFKKVEAKMEHWRVSDYLKGFENSPSAVDHLVADLQQRRDRYCH